MGFRVLAFLAVLIAAGCGGESPRQSISGEVTLDDKPVEVGVIRFVPQQGTKAPSVGGSINDGEYDLAEGSGPLVGAYRVEISSPQKGDKQVVVVPGEDPGYENVETIPPEYNRKSTLTVTIVEGSNEKDFLLKSAPAN